MPETTIAERLLARFTSPASAAALVGDLLELHPDPERLRTSLAMNLAVAGLALRIYWRPLLAIPFATLMVWGRYSPGGWVMHLHSPKDLIEGVPYGSAQFWQMISFQVLFGLLWQIFPYLAFRFGFRDPLVQLTAVIFVVLDIGWLMWTGTHTFVLALAGLVPVACFAAVIQRYRKPAVFLALEVLVAAVSLQLVLAIQNFQVAYLIRHHLETAPLNLWPLRISIYLGLLNLCISTWVGLKWLHRQPPPTLVSND
jgi:hypothetical protein